MAIVSTWYSGRLSHQLAQTKVAEKAKQQASESAQLRLWNAYLAEIAARTANRRIGERTAALETVDRAASLLNEIGRTSDRVVQLRTAAISALTLTDIRRLRSLDACP